VRVRFSLECLCTSVSCAYQHTYRLEASALVKFQTCLKGPTRLTARKLLVTVWYRHNVSDTLQIL